MSIQIPSSIIGRFTDVAQAKAYVNAQAAKKAILTAGQHIAAMDNKPQDLNVERGSVVATNVHVPGAHYPGDAMATFTPVDAPPAPAKPKGLLSFLSRERSTPETPLPMENLKSVYYSGSSPQYPQTFTMSPADNGRRFEYVNHTQKMVFTEDVCGNLVIEEMTGY